MHETRNVKILGLTQSERKQPICFGHTNDPALYLSLQSARDSAAGALQCSSDTLKCCRPGPFAWQLILPMKHQRLLDQEFVPPEMNWSESRLHL